MTYLLEVDGVEELRLIGRLVRAQDLVVELEPPLHPLTILRLAVSERRRTTRGPVSAASRPGTTLISLTQRAAAGTYT